MRQGRLIGTGVAALAAAAIAPAGAWAAPSPLVDTDFSGGTPDGNTWVVEPGSLRLKPAVSANFDGSALAPGWTWTGWNDPPTTPPSGSATVANGAVTVDGARVNTETIPAGVGGVLEFRAKFSNATFEHVGFGDDFNNQGPWAMFSTGAAGTGLFARTRVDAATPSVDTPVAIPGFDRLQPHLYRIEWTATDVKFYVDGTLVATPPAVITGSMRPVISDFAAGGGAVTVDWIARSPNPSPGTFESRVLEADGAGAQWGKLTSSGGTNVSFETRSGDSPSTMSPYKAVGADGAIQSPPGKLIQYKATLAGTADATPSLDDVTIAYTGGSTPTTTTSGAGASGTAAGSGGGTGTNPGGVSSVDTKAPVIGLASRTLLASASGKVKLRLSCPADETSCKVVVRLKDGRKTIARNSATLSGGKTSKVTLRLTRKARRKLAARGRLQLKAVVTARDAAGNRSKSKFSVTLRPR